MEKDGMVETSPRRRPPRGDVAQDPRTRFLKWSAVVFLLIQLSGAAVLPQFLTGGDYLRDPAFWAAVATLPAFAVVFWLIRWDRGPLARRAFVATVAVSAWIFSALIQGSGYLVGNYAYLTVIVLLAAFFLDARWTAGYAVANLAVVAAIHTYVGLAFPDLLLSITYIVMFSGMLILIAWLLEGESRRLAALSARQQQILDTIADSIITVDLDGNVLDLNHRALAMSQETIGRSFQPGMTLYQQSPEGLHGTVDEVLAAARDGREYDETVLVPAADGARHIRVRTVLTDDRPPHLILFSTDVTEQIRRQEEMRLRMEQEVELESLERLNTLQKQFINMASHELQTPLTPLVIQARLLRKHHAESLSKEQARAVEILDRSAQRMQRLVEDILEVVRLGSGRLPVRFSEVDLVAIVREGVAAYSPRAKEEGLQVAVDAPESLWLVADPQRLHQIVGNLVSNAVKFTGDGGHVRLSCRLDDDHARLSVQDDGPGLSRAEQAMLFRPFAQFHQDRFPGQGTGLGLAICKGLAEMHGGHLTVQSPGRGQGATFTLELPLQPPRGGEEE